MDVQTAEEVELIESRIATLSLSEDPNAKLKIFDMLMRMGMNFRDKREYPQAIDAFKRAIDADSNRPDAHCLLASTLIRSGKESEGIKSYQSALKLCPDRVKTLEGLATVRFHQKNFKEAERLCRRAIEISKDSRVAFELLGKVLGYKGDVDGLMELHRKDPNGAVDIGDMYRCNQLCCDWTDYADGMTKLSDLIDRCLANNEKPPINDQSAQYFFPLSLQQQLAIACYFAEKSKSTAEPIEHRLIGEGKRLRVGYIYTGSTGCPLDLKGYDCGHNPARVEIFRYCLTDIKVVKSATGQMKLKRNVDGQHWSDHMVNLSKFGDDFFAAANRIASDGIQILINLDCRLLDLAELEEILSHRPAPIQAVYRNTLGTTGAEYVDYFITDKVASPLRFAHGYSEKLAYLPNGMFVASEGRLQVKQKKENLKKKYSLRRRFGLPPLPFVFGVQSESWRIDPETFECWCEILRRVPGSVVWMMEVCSDEAKSNLKKEAKRHRVNPSRLVFAPFATPKVPVRLDYLVDVVLDTPMCNAINLIDLIAAAIPIVTLPMKTFTSRLTASMLTSIGCEELIAKSKWFYTEMAINLGIKPKLLAEMRDRMWENLPNSNLFKIDQFYVDLENLYEKMWKWREMGEKPEHLV